MTGNAQSFNPGTNTMKENEFEGVYGRYSITRNDELEVQRYRLALLLCGVTFSAGLGQWLVLGPTWAWVWLLPMAIGLGLALQWIHIYLRPLHQALQLLWALGCLGAVLIALRVGTDTMLSTINTEPAWTWAIGPLFAALTGVGFKEFFCFGRPEAIGLTLLIPTALLGHLSGLMGGEVVMALLTSAALLLLVLALRKFGMDAAADVGDKSVFDYLSNQQASEAL
ncbi:MAG: DUF2301 domain-containing membrane protein [Prochlorococcaceae cyanobacterium ETNP2_MAG_10]|nr:DUF2301 domain-containing membrane protein [Prochlorococcaceae cyanobacterium ETNP2_MAG_10]